MLFSIIKHLLAGYSDNGRFIVPLDTNKLIIIPYTSQKVYSIHYMYTVRKYKSLARFFLPLIYLLTMYIFCVYLVMLKSAKQMQNQK